MPGVNRKVSALFKDINIGLIMGFNIFLLAKKRDSSEIERHQHSAIIRKFIENYGLKNLMSESRQKRVYDTVIKGT